MTLSDVRGVVLAGGQSQRFGEQNKALATLDGETLIERVVTTVRAATEPPPIVAVRDGTQADRFQSVLAAASPTYVRDSVAFRGPLAGLAAAVSAADTPWVFLCGCDMPLLSADVIRWLADHRSAGTDAVCLATDGGTEPLHGFYRRASVERVLDRLDETAGLHAVLSELPACRTVPAAEAPPDSDAARSVANVNTRAVLETLRTEENREAASR